jgi:chromosome segregation ATPase
VETELDKKKQEILTLQTTISRAKQYLGLSREDAQRIKLDNAVDDFVKQYHLLQADKASLEKQLSKQKTELAQLQETIESQASTGEQLEDAKTTINQLQSSSRTQSSKMSQLQSQLARMKQDYDKVLQENSEYLHQLEVQPILASQSQYASASQQLDNIMNTLPTGLDQSTLTELEQQLDQLNVQMSGLDRQIQDQWDQVRSIMGDIHTAQTTLSSMDRELGELVQRQRGYFVDLQ